LNNLKRITRYIFLSFFSIASVLFSKIAAQSTNQKLLEKARNCFSENRYNSAIGFYLILLKSDSANIEYQYEIAQCYYYSDSLKLEAIPHFEFVLNHSADSLPELFYYLGKTYQLANHLDDALACYKEYLRLFKLNKPIVLKNVFSHRKKLVVGSDQEGDYFLKEVRKNMEECKNARDIMERPQKKMDLNGKKKEYEIENLGTNVNSKYDDYGAVVSPGDTLLFFTSRRKFKNDNKVDPEDGKYFEHIYVSKLKEEGWGEAEPLGPSINTKKSESLDFLSVNGGTLYFCRGTQNGTFYFSNRNGQNWDKPKKLDGGGEINSNEWQTSMSYSVSDNTLYVVCDKERGYGNRDIYSSKKTASGHWGPLENLGPMINTEFDEEAPYVTPDGRYLYFASKGHNSMGGFDIYKSERINNSWTEPQNLGYPINTTGNDMYFILAGQKGTAYYASSRGEQDRSNADMDIYSITLCDDLQETVLKGLVTSIDGLPKDLFVSVTDKKTQKKVAGYTIGRDGKYEITLLRNVDYVFSFEGKGIIYFATDVTLPKQCKAYELFQKVEISKRIDIPNKQWIQKADIINAFFDIRKKVLIDGRFKSTDEFQNYSEYLKVLSSKVSRLNYKKTSVETCLSDIYDLSELKLQYYDSLNNAAESSSVDKNGIFIFSEFHSSGNGIFRLEGNDPQADYQVIVCIGTDTLQALPMGDGFVLPKTRLNFYNPEGKLTESARVNFNKEFVFHKHDLNHPGTFKLEKGDLSYSYPVRLSRGGGSKC